MDIWNLAITVNHDSSMAVSCNDEIVGVYEMERITKVKNFRLNDDITPLEINLPHVLNFLPQKNFNTLFYSEIEGSKKIRFIKTLFENISFKNTVYSNDHHLFHATSAFYQSPFQKALIISYDGGGSDGSFNVYVATRDKGVKLKEKLDLNLGAAYSIFGSIFREIKWESDKFYCSLIYPGKIMGLSGYGNPDPRLTAYIKKFLTTPSVDAIRDKENFKNFLYQAGITDKQDVSFHYESQRFRAPKSHIIAASLQEAFNIVVANIVQQYMKSFEGLDIIFTGGCALNIIATSYVEKVIGKNIFVPPNCHDGGLAVGMLLNRIKPSQPVDLTYSGLPVLGVDEVGVYQWPTFNINDVAERLVKGHIIGVMQGRAEHGPRALGNRSILAYAGIQDMKDIINKKIKNREPYRPFAPVVRLEDAHKYFEIDRESRWMTHCFSVHEHFKQVLPAVTHVDGTARVQTVTRTQNTFLYDLLTAVEEKTGIGVLVNTSLNVDGQPIATFVEQGLQILRDTEMDALIVNDRILTKDS